MITSIVFGFICGYIIGTLYYQWFNVVYHGPDSNKVKDNIFYDDRVSMCYRLLPQISFCPV